MPSHPLAQRERERECPPFICILSPTKEEKGKETHQLSAVQCSLSPFDNEQMFDQRVYFSVVNSSAESVRVRPVRHWKGDRWLVVERYNIYIYNKYFEVVRSVHIYSYKRTPFIVPTKCTFFISINIKWTSTTCFGTYVQYHLQGEHNASS
jgi:hypothetical protein